MPKKAIIARILPIALAAVILGVMSIIALRDSSALSRRKEDMPPVIDFTWTPLGPTDLRDMKGFLAIKDDYALDFKSYRMRIIELDKSYDLPIDGMMGKEYDQNVSLSLLADNAILARKGQVTLEFSIADDRGQHSTISRTIKLKPAGDAPLDITLEPR